ncbi:MAG: YdcF family protein [Firmicutes bacterium]|nr:YdcF family protein [Bacillota bacterium]
MANRLKFDTRDKKPKLYHLLIEAAIVDAVLLLLLRGGLQEYGAAASALLAVFFAAVVIQLVAAFFEQIQYNPYSYNTIYYMGFALFVSSVFLFQVYLTVQMLRFPQVFTAWEILRVLLNSAKIYMLLSAPFILVFSAALCISNISLIRHEGRRPVNLLGILLSFLLLAGEVFLFCFDYYATGSQWQVMLHDLLANLLSALYLYFECMLIGAMVADAIAARHEPEPDKDFMIILGCGLRKDGSPSPLLQGRIDRALAFYRKQKAQTGRELIFVTSGGRGPNEAISESAAMKRYLLQQGVPAERIIEEDLSTSTFENMKFSKEKIRQIDGGGQGKIVFATTNYHVFRSGLCARRVKMRAVGVGAKTKWYFWPNAAVREFVGLLTEHRGKQALILGGLLAFYTVLTLLNYSVF